MISIERRVPLDRRGREARGEFAPSVRRRAAPLAREERLPLARA